MSEEFIDPESIKGENKLFQVFNILDKKVLLCKKYLSLEKYVWTNPFTLFPKIWVAEVDSDDKAQVDKAVAVSAFMMYNKSVYVYYSNTNYDNLFKALIESDKSPSIVTQFALKTQCDLIHAYDTDRENIAVLETALKYGDWLEENTELDKNCLLINKCQIIKRRDGNMTPNNYEKIAKLTTNENSSIQFAAYTLLENKQEALKSLKNTIKEEKESLITSPIYCLYKDIN